MAYSEIDPITGKRKNTPLDVKIQCAGLVLKQETPTAEQ
jgi:hypothetical protein